jgi:hypothetical protein
MKIYGTLDMQDNLLVNLSLDVESSFPTTPSEGRLVFYNNVLYICVMVEGSPSWIPLTNELQTLVYTNMNNDSVWIIPHNYGTRDLIVQPYDADNKTVIPDSIDLSDINAAVVTFSAPVSGKAVVICRRVIPV